MRINYPAVFVAAVVHFIIGGLWYGLLFGNKFIELIGWSPEKTNQVGNQSHTKEYLAAFASSLVICFVLAHFVQYTKARNALDGVQTAFWLWLGFIVTTQLSTVVFEERKPGLYLLNIGYQLVACAIAGVIVTLWKSSAAQKTAEQAV